MEIFGGDGSLQFVASLNTNPFTQGREALSREIRMLTQDASQQAASIDNLYKKASTALAGYVSLTAGTNLIKDIVRVRGEMEQLSVAFETMLGSKQKADELMNQVVKFAATTPYGLTEVAGVTKQLLAYGFAADKIEDTLRRLGDVASGISAPLGDVAYLYGTIKTAGVANAVDIKQFAQRGIPIYEALAKVLKTDVEHVKDFVSAGKVGFGEVEQAFKNLTDTGSQFGGLMEKQSHTLTGVLSNLSDSFDQMLNNIGKSNSGLAYSVIGFAQDAVANYQKIVDVLKVAVTVYGSYRAALLLSVAAERLQQEAMLQTALAGGNLSKSQATLAATQRLLQGGAKGIFDSLTSPTAAATAAIAGLTFIIYSLTQVVDAAVESQKNLASIEAEGTKAGLKEKDTIQSLVSVLNSKTRSHEDQIKAINKLRDITGPYLKNYTDEEILAGKAKDAIKEYIASIEQMAKVKAASDKLTELEGKLIDISTKGADALDFAEKFGNATKAAFGFGDYSKVNYLDQLLGIKDGTNVNSVSVEKAKSDIQRQINDIKGIYGKGLEDLALTGANAGTDIVTNAAKLTNKQMVDVAKSLEDLDTLKKQIDDSYSKSKDQSNREALASDLKYLDARRKAFDAYSSDKQASKTNEQAISKVNSLFEKQRSLLEQINALHHDAIQSGLLQQESEVDKINQKYDDLLSSIREQNDLYDKISKQYPGGVAAYNKQNPDNQVVRIQQPVIDRVNLDRTTELNNSNYKADADAYLKHLDDLKALFSQYEDAKKDIGIDRANELYSAQTKGFDNYVDYLKDQEAKLKAVFGSSILFGGLPDIGTQLKLKGVSEAQTNAGKDQTDKLYEDTKASYTRIITLTNSFNEQRKNLDQKYEKDRKQLESTYKGEDLKQRQAALKEYYDNEKQQVDINETYQTEVYKKLNENILNFTKEQILERIKYFRNLLDTNPALSPVTRQAIGQMIDQLTGLVIATDKSQKNITETLEKAAKLQGALGNLSSSLQNVNKDLADIVGGLGNAVGSFSGVLQGIKDFDAATIKKDTSAQIAAGVNIASSVIQAAAQAYDFYTGVKQSQKQVAKELLQYQSSLVTGEIQYNQLLRERARTQEDISKLTTQELLARQEMLDLQKQQAQADYDKLLKQIQASGKQVTALNQEKTGGFFTAFGAVGGALLGRKSKTSQELAGLSDVDYDTLEKLFSEGKLTDETKSWFEALQTAHNEISGIGDSLTETKDRLTEILTGTTADALASTISDGFRKGYSSIYDFGDTINDVVRNALFSAFQVDAVKPAIQPLIDELAELSKDGLDSFDITKFIGDANTSLLPLVDQAKTIADVLNKAGIGSSSSSSNQNNLIGAQTQATEQTQQLVAGQFGALRLTAAEQLQVSQQTLSILNIMAAHTADIPNVKAILQDMNNRGIKIRG